MPGWSWDRERVTCASDSICDENLPLRFGLCKHPVRAALQHPRTLVAMPMRFSWNFVSLKRYPSSNEFLRGHTDDQRISTPFHPVDLRMYSQPGPTSFLRRPFRLSPKPLGAAEPDQGRELDFFGTLCISVGPKGSLEILDAKKIHTRIEAFP